MKILVFSDSHQKSNYMKEAIDYNLESGDIDCIFHLGDGVSDLEGLTLRIPICYVDGNYDEVMYGCWSNDDSARYMPVIVRL